MVAALNYLLNGACPHYVLDGHTPVKATDYLAWLAWYETAERHVAQDCGEGWELSTVFLALATLHPRQGTQPEPLPALFETCLFRDGMHAQVLMRYDTWEEAEHGHAQFLAVVQAWIQHR